MDASDWTAAASVVIAAAALLLSVWTFNRQRRAEGRANLTAEWDILREITVTNYGPGAARDLHLTRAGGGDDTETVTRGYIPALQTVRIYAPDRRYGESPEVRLSIAWSDNRRARQTYTVELNPPPGPPHTPQPPKGGAVDDAVRKVAEDSARRLLRERDNDSLRRMRRR